MEEQRQMAVAPKAKASVGKGLEIACVNWIQKKNVWGNRRLQSEEDTGRQMADILGAPLEGTDIGEYPQKIGNNKKLRNQPRQRLGTELRKW